MITINFNQVHVENDIALGNHLFQYAICRIVALKNNYNFYIPYSGRLKQCFPDIDLGIKDGEIMYQYNDTQMQEYNPNIFSLPNFTNIWGFFQSEKYFQGYEENIKEWFKIKSDEHTEILLNKYPIEEYCYLHIRGSGNKNTEIMLPKSFYEKGIEEVKKINSNLKFVIITDDYDISKEYFPELDVISSDVMSDFKMMYFSKYAIISNSTFSWWSCWLSDKLITVAPERWYNYGKHMGENIWYPFDIKSEKFTYI
jgi:hypothetical protein